MSNSQLRDITLFNDNSDLSLKSSWICPQILRQKSVIHRVLSFHCEVISKLVREQ